MTDITTETETTEDLYDVDIQGRLVEIIDVCMTEYLAGAEGQYEEEIPPAVTIFVESLRTLSTLDIRDFLVGLKNVIRETSVAFVETPTPQGYVMATYLNSVYDRSVEYVFSDNPLPEPATPETLRSTPEGQEALEKSKAFLGELEKRFAPEPVQPEADHLSAGYL